MLNLRVLISTYHQAYLIPGGGEYELQSIAEGLRQLGIVADIYGPYSRAVEFYDVVLHFSMHPGGLELLRELRNKGLPIIVWPNLWFNSPSLENMSIIQEHVNLAKWVAFKSRSELDNFKEYTGLSRGNFVTCKWIGDSCYLKDAPHKLFNRLYEVNDYALWFGIVEPIKNQLSAIRVLGKKGIPLVIVGRYRDEEYYKQCQREGGDNVLFLNGLPQKSTILRSAFQNALFYLELSHEPPGLSALEAGLSGCRLLLSDSAWSREHFDQYAEYVNPHSEQSINEGVSRILQMPMKTKEVKEHMAKYCFPAALQPLVNLLKRTAQ